MMSRAHYPGKRKLNEDQKIRTLVAGGDGHVSGAARACAGPGVRGDSGDEQIKSNVKASVPIAGNFDKWTATLKFASADVTSGSWGPGW